MRKHLLACLVLLLVASMLPAAEDALDVVNAQRAARGLPPFIRDPLLTQAAMNCADRRAEILWEGHFASDFAALPPGAWADCTGCAAWPPEYGFGACETYGYYRFAGAAWTRGRDGLNYCHLFLRR